VDDPPRLLEDALPAQVLDDELLDLRRRPPGKVAVLGQHAPRLVDRR
jgi:hypothetical protein